MLENGSKNPRTPSKVGLPEDVSKLLSDPDEGIYRVVLQGRLWLA